MARLELRENTVQELTNAVKTASEMETPESVAVDERMWFKVFKNPRAIKENEIDIVLMNGCADTPFMCFADSKDSNLLSSIDREVNRIVNEFNMDLEMSFDVER